MSEVPDFLKGIDPDMVRDMDRRMDEEADRHAEHEMTVLEECLENYLDTLANKLQAIDLYIYYPSVDSKLLLLKADEATHMHFLLYLDRLLTASPMINKTVRVVQALSAADGSQAKINERQLGNQYIYELTELRSLIAEIFLSENISEQKKDIVSIYEDSIRYVLMQFLR